MSPLPPDGLTIRSAGLDDISAVVELVGALAAYEKRESENCLTEECLRAEFTSDDCVLSAFGRDQVKPSQWQRFSQPSRRSRRSVVCISKTCSSFRNIAVRRRHGLLRYIAKMAVERDCGRIEWTTLLWNTPAVEFYESLGARPNDAWTAYRLSGEWLAKLAAGGVAARHAVHRWRLAANPFCLKFDVLAVCRHV